MKDAPNVTLGIVSKLLERNCPTSIVQLFLDLQVGSKLPINIIAKLRQTALVRKHSSPNEETTAEVPMCMLPDDTKIACACYASSCDEANQLVKVRRKRKNGRPN